MSARAVITFCRRIVQGFLDDDCLLMAAAVSYYAVFSLFPLTLAIISILGFVLKPEALQAQLIDEIGGLMPVSRELVTSTIKEVVRARGATGLAASLLFLVSARGVFSVISKAVNIAWGVSERPFLRGQLVDLSMTVGAGTLFLLSIASTAALKLIRELSFQVPSPFPMNGDLMWDGATAALPATLTFLTFLFLYRLVPNAPVRWREVWLGALVAALGFEVAKNVFVWYVGNIANYNLVYGPVSGVVALLMWSYISAVILLLGAEFASVHSKATTPKARQVASRGTSTEGRHPLGTLTPVKVILGLGMLAIIAFDTFGKLMSRKGKRHG